MKILLGLIVLSVLILGCTTTSQPTITPTPVITATPTDSCVCTQQYSPVCGVDGKTYGNDCQANCASIEVAYEGECTVPTEQPTIQVKKYTIEEISLHNTQADCWLLIEGKVYNPPENFASLHPGGTAYLAFCGKDATQAFNQRPNDGTSHSETARGFAASFLIGELA
ncbi:hypothetical protein HUU53_01790 [Candidatus Micrarchaeota archaeon]|nr:hypothetical protein [Candidatus Micrarchaeota archaeon]